MVVMVKLRSLLFKQLDRINTKLLPFFSPLEEGIHDTNFRVMLNLVKGLKESKTKLYDGLHDFNRWQSLLVRIINETEHYLTLLDTSFSEHCAHYHEITIGPNSVCPCWSYLVRDLRNEFGYLRKRLF